MKKKTKTYYDFNEMVEIVEGKYGFNYRDYHNKWYGLSPKVSIHTLNAEHHFKWQNDHYPIINEWEVDPIDGSRFNKIGTDFLNSPEGKKFWDKIGQEYISDPEGKAKEYEYMDLWHYILDCYPEINNGCIIPINWSGMLEYAKKDWQKQALKFFVDKYGKKDYNVEISW